MSALGKGLLLPNLGKLSRFPRCVTQAGRTRQTENIHKKKKNTGQKIVDDKNCKRKVDVGVIVVWCGGRVWGGVYPKLNNFKKYLSDKSTKHKNGED